MAIFKEMRRVRWSASKAFDGVLRPGTLARFEGIYRCVGCDAETAVAGGGTLPAAEPFEHPKWCPGIQWQLLVATTGATPPPKGDTTTPAA